MTRVAGRSAGSPGPRSADAARVAGVSRKTVSRVLNDEPYVSDAVRRRVVEAAGGSATPVEPRGPSAPASGRNRSTGAGALGTVSHGSSVRHLADPGSGASQDGQAEPPAGSRTGHHGCENQWHRA
jgi:hypothetical protein